ncbi:MAG: hypothetical protein IK125_00650 [Lachnospiraceae bacterium]|nr:hypothetical protein [Lachnospiraceae bacterium]
MLTAEERVRVLHERMDERRRRRERRKTVIMGIAISGIAACLLMLIIGGGTAHFGGTAGMYSGATMLFDGVGGYVLVGVVSFFAAVVITVACIRWKKKQENDPNSDNNTQGEDKDHENEQ